jgi:Secretion system C-terminal sorting domain
MKRFLLQIFVFFAISAGAQNYCIPTQNATDGTLAPCCNANINTDYNFPSNPERSDLVNQFNWLNPASSASGSAIIKINRNGSSINIDHPFLNDIISRYYWYSNYRIGDPPPFENNTMHPKHGWQLLYHNFGFDIFTTTPSSNTPAIFNPVMIYYNKYTGKMRLFSSPTEGNSFDESSVKIDLVTNSTLKVNGLFSHNKSVADALDRRTEIRQVTASIPFASPNTWAGGDIQTTYDPCICKDESRLFFKFFDQDFSNVYMSGNIVGINKPLDNSGTSPLEFGKNFISSVYTSYLNTPGRSTPLSGMLVYNKIDQLVAGSYVSPQMKDLIGALDLISSVTGPVGKQLGDEELGEKIGKGLSFGSKQLKTTTPNITFLEAQGAFSGEINNISNSGGYGSFELLTPGSFHNFRQSVPWNIQPLYNEALGLFALLKTPKLVFNTLNLDEFEEEYDNKYRGLALILEEPLEYVLNPAADIDLNKTKISAAIEFDLYDDHNMPMYVRNSQNNLVLAKDYFSPTFMQLSSDAPYETIYDDNLAQFVTLPSKKRIFSTYVLPIDKLNQVSFMSFFNGGTFNNWENTTPYKADVNYPKFRLRIYVHYVFKANSYGVVNESEQTYLYDMDVRKDLEYNSNGFPCSVASNIFCGKPTLESKIGKNQTIGNINYSSNQTIYVNNLTINGNITTSNGAKVTIYYSGSVEILPGGSISPEVIIEYNDFNTHNGLTLPSEQYLKNTYCANKYKANVLKAVENKEISSHKNLATTFTLQPNPASDYTKLVIDQPVGDKAMVKVYDMVGREVYSQEMLELDKGKTSLEISTRELHRGIYIVKVIHGEVEKSLKLEVTK